MVNAEFSRIYRFVKLLVNEGFLAVLLAMKYHMEIKRERNGAKYYILNTYVLY